MEPQETKVEGGVLQINRKYSLTQVFVVANAISLFIVVEWVFLLVVTVFLVLVLTELQRGTLVVDFFSKVKNQVNLGKNMRCEEWNRQVLLYIASAALYVFVNRHYSAF